jgi:hypothetical protein
LIKSGRTSDTVFKNGWSTGRAAGGPGDDILKRAVGAKFGLGGHYAVENRSYMALTDSQRGPLSGTHELCMKFATDKLPPCDAFWSLTAYGMDLYLVENEINRYSIGDRTPDLHHDDDGGLTVILSTAGKLAAGTRRSLHAWDARLRRTFLGARLRLVSAASDSLSAQFRFKLCEWIECELDNKCRRPYELRDIERNSNG